MEPLLVRTGLIGFVVLASISVFLLWRNAAAPDALKNVGIVLAAILPVVVTVFPYLKPERMQSRFTCALVCDSKENVITLGEIPNPYFGSYLHMFTNVSKVPGALTASSIADLMGPVGMNLVEKGILEVLLLRFGQHWDVGEEIISRGPAFTSRGWVHASQEKITKLSIEQLRASFQHNRLISTPGVIVQPSMCLPPNSTLKTNQSEHARTLSISNPYLTTVISIEPIGGAVIQQGVWGILPPDAKVMDRYFAAHIRVSVTAQLARNSAYSPKMQLYRRWHDNICAALSEFDWENVERKAREDMTQQAVSKILGGKSSRAK